MLHYFKGKREWYNTRHFTIQIGFNLFICHLDFVGYTLNNYLQKFKNAEFIILIKSATIYLSTLKINILILNVRNVMQIFKLIYNYLPNKIFIIINWEV